MKRRLQRTEKDIEEETVDEEDEEEEEIEDKHGEQEQSSNSCCCSSRSELENTHTLKKKAKRQESEEAKLVESDTTTPIATTSTFATMSDLSEDNDEGYLMNDLILNRSVYETSPFDGAEEFSAAQSDRNNNNNENSQTPSTSDVFSTPRTPLQSFRWNERYQAIFEDYYRLRGTLPQLFDEFIQEAVEVGKRIISERYLTSDKKTIRPVGVRPGDMGFAGGEKFFASGIFFKYATDLYGLYGGNDEGAIKAAGAELRALNAYFGLGRKSGLSFPLMCLIDYRGFRLMASSVLPINETTLVYGSRDAGLTIHADLPAFNHSIESVLSTLNLKAHIVKGKKAGSRPVALFGPVDLEGLVSTYSPTRVMCGWVCFLTLLTLESHRHRGLDGKFYVIDVHRTFPPCTPIKGLKGVHLYRMMRPEYVRNYKCPLSSDIFTSWSSSEDTEEGVRATEQLEKKVVREFVSMLQSNASISSSIDHLNLSSLLHSHGINIRYLGMVFQLLPNSSDLKLYILSIVVARSIKNLLRREMRRLTSTNEEDYIAFTINFFNYVFFAHHSSSNHATAVDSTTTSSTRPPPFWSVVLRGVLEEWFLFCDSRNLTHVDYYHALKSRILQIFQIVQELSGVLFEASANRKLVEFHNNGDHTCSLSRADLKELGVKVKKMQCWVAPRDFLSSSQSLLASQNELYSCRDSLGSSNDNISNSSEGIEIEHRAELIIKYEDLNHIKQLEEGMTGLIWMASWMGKQVAVTHFYSKKKFSCFERVADELLSLDHPNIVKLYGICKEADHRCVVTEYLPYGTLEKYIEEMGDRLSWHLKFSIAAQVARAMKYLHSRQPPLIHSNLSAVNILVKKRTRDEGVEVALNVVRITNELKSNQTSSGWIPPELSKLKSNVGYGGEDLWTEYSDVYCYGVVLWQLMTRRDPFEEEYGGENDFPSDCPSNYALLLQSTLAEDPAHRPPFHECLNILSASSSSLSSSFS